MSYLGLFAKSQNLVDFQVNSLDSQFEIGFYGIAEKIGKIHGESTISQTGS